MIAKGIIAAVAVAGLGAGTLGMGTAHAAENPALDGKFESLIEALAERFDVSEEEVLKVFQVQHDKRQEAQQAKEADRLANAVEEGYLTQEQSDAIAAYREEREELMASLIDMSLEDRKAAMDAARGEVKEWAKEQGIPLKYVLPAHGGENHTHHGQHNQE